MSVKKCPVCQKCYIGDSDKCPHCGHVSSPNDFLNVFKGIFK